MTREEAKGNLIHAIRWNDIPKKEALDMAIKALEQEPSNDMVSHEVFDEYGNYKYPSDFELTEPNTATSMPCGDTISRQAVLDLAKKGVLISNGNYKSVCKAINEIPAVDPQNCDNCEVGNPCIYCKHDFELQESECEG